MRHKRQLALDWEKEVASKTTFLVKGKVMNNGGSEASTRGALRLSDFTN